MKRLFCLFSSIATIFLVMVMLFAVLPQNVFAAESAMSETDFQETEEESGNDNDQDTVTLTFHANGGYFPSWEWDEETQSEKLIRKDTVSGEYEIGAPFYLCWEAPLHDNETMVLLGWAEEKNATEPSVFENGETTVDGLSDLWAVWAEGIPVTYHANKDGMEFYDDDGSLHTEITRYYAKETIIYTGNMPFRYSRPEGTLWHWEMFSTDPDTNDMGCQEITLTEPVDLYCFWYEGVEIFFDSNGGYYWNNPEMTSSNPVFSLGETIDLSSYMWEELNPPESGKTLLGWSWSKDGSDRVTEITVTADMEKRTLYAIWGDGIPVTFHINNSEAWFLDENGDKTDTTVQIFAPNQELSSISSYVYFEIEEETLWSFKGLSLEPEMTDYEEWSLAITEPIDVYFLWNEGFYIRINANGGYFSDNPDDPDAWLSCTVGDIYNLNILYRDILMPPSGDKTLIGWSWSEDGSDPFTELAITRDMVNQTIYAVWGTGIPVTFHINNPEAWFIDDEGNRVDSVQRYYAEGTEFFSYEYWPPFEMGDDAPWEFAGLSLDPDGAGEEEWSIVIAEPIDVYCVWSELIEIYLDANGGYFYDDPSMSENTVRSRLSTSYNVYAEWKRVLTAPEEGKVLVGWSWSADGSDPFKEIIISKEMQGNTIYAVWADGIPVTWHVNHDTARIKNNGELVSEATRYYAYGDIIYWGSCPFGFELPEGSFWNNYGVSINPVATKPDDKHYMIKEPMDFYCLWRESINMRLDWNYPSAEGEDNTTYKECIVGETEDLVAFNPYLVHPDSDKALVGWSWSEDGSDPFTEITYTGDMHNKTLYAVWGPGIQVTIHINHEKAWFTDNDGNPAEAITRTFKSGTVLNYHDYFSLLRWQYGSDFDDPLLRFGIVSPDPNATPDDNWTLTLTEPIDLYCTWYRGVNLRCDLNGGWFNIHSMLQIICPIGETGEITSQIGGEVYHPDPDLVLAGWSWSKDGSDLFTELSFTEDMEGKTIYAIWTDAAANVPVTGISFANASAEIVVGEAISCPATVAPADATNNKVVYQSSDESIATVDENGKITGKRTGTATISATSDDGGKTATMTVHVLFKDVADSSKYWYKPVYWATKNGVTNGYQSAAYAGTDKFGTFGPEENCTREQMITFLYRTAGAPKVSGTVNFSDVKKGSYYYNAVLWAYQKGITKGYSSGPNKGKFGVGFNVTREDTVTFIYRMAGKPKYSTTKTFTDVAKGKYYYDAVRWAAQKGITKGYKDGSFGVGQDVLRKDIVTFLYRYVTN